MKKLAKAAVVAVVQYLMSKEATKLERALLAGVGSAVVLAIQHQLGL